MAAIDELELSSVATASPSHITTSTHFFFEDRRTASHHHYCELALASYYSVAPPLLASLPALVHHCIPSSSSPGDAPEVGLHGGGVRRHGPLRPDPAAPWPILSPGAQIHGLLVLARAAWRFGRRLAATSPSPLPSPRRRRRGLPDAVRAPRKAAAGLFFLPCAQIWAAMAAAGARRTAAAEVGARSAAVGGGASVRSLRRRQQLGLRPARVMRPPLPAVHPHRGRFAAAWSFVWRLKALAARWLRLWCSAARRWFGGVWVKAQPAFAGAGDGDASGCHILRWKHHRDRLLP